MLRLLSLLAVLIAVGLLVDLAQGNPLGKIRGAAKKTRQAAEEQQEKVAEEERPVAARAAAGEVEGWVLYHAVAVVTPTEGSTARGVVRFRADKRGLMVTAKISGLTPHQKHGFHIHEFGDISDPQGKATGGYYDPEGRDHALPARRGHQGHAGDLGSLQADAKGNATYKQIFTHITISRHEYNPILGRAVIIHAREDDGSQPTGNAGPRIAQGVIGVARPQGY